MSRTNFCEACNMIRNGVKTRIALTHTCGLERGAIPEDVKRRALNDGHDVSHLDPDAIEELKKAFKKYT